MAKRRGARKKSTASRRRSPARRSTARRRSPARRPARKAARRSTARRRSPARKVTARKATRRPVKRKAAARSSSPSMGSVSAAPMHAVHKKKRDDLAAMYLSILIIGIAGIILLIAKPTAIMQKIIGILLVVLGIWGLLAKK